MDGCHVTVQNHPVKIIAHRGASGRAPENTLAAFRAAWEDGAAGIEADLRLTGDGVPVLIHDATTARCGDQNLVVAESTFEELRGVDFGLGERIPSLDEALNCLPEDTLFFLEIKDSPPEAVAKALENIFSSRTVSSFLVLICFHPEILEALQLALPDIPRLQLIAELDTPFLPLVEVAGYGFKAGLDFHPEMLADLKARGAQLNVWTVNEPAEARRYRELGFDSLTTDWPARFRTPTE